MAAAHDTRVPEASRFDIAFNSYLREALRKAFAMGVPSGATQQALDYARQGFKSLEIEEYDTGWDSEAYNTVSGQNSNNSVRLTNAFFNALDKNDDWALTSRTNGNTVKTIKAADLWEQIGLAAWQCADPGLQFDDTIQEWHTCSNDERINATNPCVTGDTLVATADGPVRIKDMVGKSAFIIGSDGKPHFVNKIFRTGHMPVYRLITKSGYTLELTADHKVLTENRGDVPASGLRPGDRILLSGSGFGNVALDQSTASRIGHAIRVGTSTAPADGKLAPGGGSIAQVAAQPAAAPYVVVEQGTIARLSDAVFALDKASTSALLSGLITADGELESQSAELLHQVQYLLLSLGMKAIARDHRLLIEPDVLVTSDEFLALEPISSADVFDLTEPDTSHFVANGLRVHNCSEYIFIDDTACNLCSVNLVKFLNDNGDFDANRLAEAARLWTTTLEISVTMGQMPSKAIAEKNHGYRTLGLGYANLGTLLMRLGLPYDSEEGFGWCAAITALLTGTAYRTSAEMAQQLGPFARFDANREPMLRVIRNHRRAAYNAPKSEYEGLTITPVTHAPTLFTQETWALARKMWDDALAIGEVSGFRNAQTTVCAPTGTIGLVMDCDTTGIEPDFALVKFKKLAGGGYFKIVNQSVDAALHRLGYSQEQIEAIEIYAKGTGTLLEAPAH